MISALPFGFHAGEIVLHLFEAFGRMALPLLDLAQHWR